MINGPLARIRRMFAAAIFILLVITIPVAAQEIVPSERVRTSVVVRQDPVGPPSPKVGSLRLGERAVLLESVPYFYKVRLSNGVIGYVAKSWTKRIDAEMSALAQGDGTLAIHFIDVGQGDSTLIICPNGATILADTGSTSGRSPDEVRQYITRQIENLGSGIDYLLVSHPDADHYNLLREVLDDVPVGRAWYVGQASDYYDHEVFDWLTSVPARSDRLLAEYFDPVAQPNPDIDCGQAKVWILASAVEHPDSRKNAMSIVFMVRYGDFEAVITGDATTATEGVILSRYPARWLDVDVLRVGHHGSLATSTAALWADTLSPEAAVFSAGYQNTYGHPRTEVVDRLTPHTRNVPAHAFRSWKDNPDSGPRYLVQDVTEETEAIYATAMNRTIVMRSRGSGFTTTLGN